MPGSGLELFGAEEKRELMDVMRSGHLSRYGELNDPNFKRKVVTFEKDFAKYAGVKHAVAVSGGTGALMCCLRALEIGAGDEVIVPGYTFIASISSILLMGATPVLAEIDGSLTIDPADIERKITPRTKAILPVHMLGNPCDMDAIMEIARRHGLYVIEDCCQAAGASYKGRKVGSIGDIGAYSLNSYKTITADDGGVVVVNDDERYARAFGFHDQGHSPNRAGIEIGRRSIVGMNMRINELTDAVALAQLRKLDGITGRLRRNKKRLKDAISDIPNLSFRVIHGADEEVGTILTLLFPDKEKADAFTAKVGQKTLAHSGWHAYNNMEQILAAGNYHKHMLPQTDAISLRMQRSMRWHSGSARSARRSACKAGTALGDKVRGSRCVFRRILVK